MSPGIVGFVGLVAPAAVRGGRPWRPAPVSARRSAGEPANRQAGLLPALIVCRFFQRPLITGLTMGSGR